MWRIVVSVAYFITLFWVGERIVLALHDGEHPLVVDYSEHYYYLSLKEKMTESLSINNCSLGGDLIAGKYQDNGEFDLKVKMIPPPKHVLDKWGPSNTIRSNQKLFTQVSDNLCSSRNFKDAIKGFYKRAKGCYKVYAVDKQGRRYKRFNDYGATLHPEHIRCDNAIAATVCNSAGSVGMQVVNTTYRSLNSYPFMITAEKVIIGRGGMFGMPCGPFGLFASCEAVKWGVPAANVVVPDVETCRDPSKQCPYPKYKKVFILTQYDDTQIGQFMQENLPKLIYHLDYLKKNKDVKIHFGFTKRSVLPNFVLPHNFFQAFGLLDRLINGTVYAEEIIMPREGGCQDIGYNAWEMVTMRETIYKILGIREKKTFEWRVPVKPTVVVLTRSAGPFTQNKADYMRRSWPESQLPSFLEALKDKFPNHDVVVFSDKNTTLMTCPLCQAEIFAKADLVIGHHGAGLSNTMFMKPGGVMVEVVYNYDSRHLPILGIFPRISDIIGLHHYIYYIKDVNLNLLKLADDIETFYKKAKLWSS